MAEAEKKNRGLGWGVLSWPDYVRQPHELVAAVAYAFLVLLLLAVLAIAVSLLSRVLFAAFGPENLDPIKSADDFNKILLGLGGLIGAVTAVPFLVWRTMIAQKQNVIAQENIHSTTMAKAIEQLGAMKEVKTTQNISGPDGVTRQETVTNSEPNIEVRLGAIYLLEKLAREHKQLHWPIMEILCAYIRGNAGRSEPPPEEVVEAYSANERRTQSHVDLITKYRHNVKLPRVDIQAAITVIGRRSKLQLSWEKSLRKSTKNQDSFRIDLSECNLARISFDGLNFDYAKFNRSSLQFSSFRNANVNHASFMNTHFEEVSLNNTNLNRSKFLFTYLYGSSFFSVNLVKAEFFGAHISVVSFLACHLELSSFFGSNPSHLYFNDSHLEGAELRWSGADNISFKDSIIHDLKIDDSNMNTAVSLTDEMTALTWGNAKTMLPSEISRPINSRWQFDSEPNQERISRWFERRKYWLSRIKEELKIEELDDE